MSRAAIEGVYLLTPDWSDTERLIAATEAALRAGVRWLQYRHKTADAALRELQARRLREITRRHGARLIINDDVTLAHSIGAAGVHLGRDDAAAAAVRRDWPDGVIGVSCYGELERAMQARDEGADYVAFGSVFASRTKPQAVRAPLVLLTRARSAGLRTVAIGGIDAANIAAVAAAGAHAAALITAVYEAAEPEGASRQLIEQWTRGRRSHEQGPQPGAV